MLRLVFTFLFVLFGPMAHANQSDDADFFVANFIDEANWIGTYRSMKSSSPRFYRSALLERNVTIVDKERFKELMPDDATEEAVQLMKSHASAFVSEEYGAENLAEIAAFFRTTTGKKMLKVARDEKLFDRQFYRRSIGGPMQQWRRHLSTLEIARYSAFTNSPAGQVFIRDTFTIRKSLFYQLNNKSLWPKPPLNRPYIVNILKTDNVLHFPNRVARQSLIRELSISYP